MIKRESEQTLLELFGSFPVVTITGPRQSGKTTLVKNCFPEKPYVSLENPTTREFAGNDPVGFLNQELYSDNIQRLDDVLYSGFYPGIYDQKIKPGNFHSATCLERDVRQISKVHDLSLFQKFIGLCAGRTGQIVQ